ncbi:MAG: GGDEF domain-containing protein [Lachnospiraceae bacterium]|nr:GGDEF domain-containing protein [Lachnospiraceae bacterium]
MSDPVEERREGVSLKEINFAFLILAILISGILIWAMARTNVLYAQTHETTQRILKLKDSTSGLQTASDYLTEQIRCFAVTGDVKYLDNYFEEADVTRRREKALEELENNGYAESEAVRNLKIAMSESVNLMEREYYSARLTYEAYDLDLSAAPAEIRAVELKSEDASLSREKMKLRASELLFDDYYRTEKEEISKYIKNCLNQLSNEMDKEQSVIAEKMNKQVMGEHVLTFVLIGIMIGIVLLSFVLIINPLQKCVELIREEKSIPPKGAYEIRFLAKTYNLMYNMNLANIDKLTFDATHDQVTGLYNRRGYDFLAQNIDLKTSTLLRINVDNCKEITEKLGRDSFESVLKRTATVLSKNVRSHDYVFRFEGDEFAILMMHVDSDREELIRNKVKIINEKLKTGEGEIPGYTASVGVAFGEEDTSPEELYKYAEDALSIAKKKGHGSVNFFRHI